MVSARDVTRANVTNIPTLTLDMTVTRKSTERRDATKDARNLAIPPRPKNLATRRSTTNGTTPIRAALALNVRNAATWSATMTARRSAQRNKSGDGKKRRFTQANLALQNLTLTLLTKYRRTKDSIVAIADIDIYKGP